jgi:hypothetical protein
MDLETILNEITKMHSGVYKWFNQYARSGEINASDFFKSVSDLGVRHVATLQQIYAAL